MPKTVTSEEVATSPQIPREVEVKYLVRDLESLREWIASDWGGALDGVETGNPQVVEVEDRYFDTAFGALKQAGFSARLRREDGGPYAITVKSASRERPGHENGRGSNGSAALSQRVEVEGPANERLDPDDWPPSTARELINEVRDDARLHTLFSIGQRREQRTLVLDDGPVQLTLDSVTVIRGARALSSFSVLEVEASGGSGARLAGLGAVIEATGYVIPEPRSKEEIARHYVAKAAEHPSHRLPRAPRSPGIGVDDTLGEAGRKVLRMHLARMLHFEAGTRSGEDIEDLHRMRVATRRMRAAWRVFDDAYRPKVQRRYVRELRGIARALGRVRDMDVLLQNLDRYLESLPGPGQESMEPLRAAWRRRRETERRRLIARLDSRQYREFVADYLDFTESPRAGQALLPLGQPSLVKHTAGSLILGAYERVHAYETTFAWADVPTLHALRIEGKRLRYAMEDFAEVLPDTARALIAHVKEMQDHLGLMNDADVAAIATREWLSLNAPSLSTASREAVGTYLDAREAEVEQLRRSFGPLWRRITGRTFRRALGAAITQIE